MDEDWLVTEVVSRLPVKSLFLFKTVSKNWLSLIDSHIAFTKSRLPCRMFIVHPLPKIVEEEKTVDAPWEELDDNELDNNELDNELDIRPYIEYFITCDVLFEDKQLVVDKIREVDTSSDFCNMILKPANGLICLVDSDVQHAVRICNVSTGELSPWFGTEPCMLFKDENGRPYRNFLCKIVSSTYAFGFDPVTNTHKVVAVWSRRSGESVCCVLTVGVRKGYDENNTWRKIETPPYANKLSGVSIYVNGFIYWTTLDLRCGSWGSEFRPVCLVAFDVGSEKFRTITIPDFILDLPHCSHETGHLWNPYMTNDGNLVDLLEVDGNLAMSIKMSDKMYKIFMYRDCDGSWSEVSIVLPFDLEKDQYVRFHGYGSSEKIILILTDRHVCRKEAGKERCVSIYCYDWKKDSWFKFEVNGIPSSIPHLCYDSFFTTFSPSLLAP